MSIFNLYKAIVRKGYNNSFIQKRLYIDMISEHELRDLLELDRKEVFKAVYGREEYCKNLSKWKCELTVAEDLYSDHKIDYAIDYLLLEQA